MTANTSEAGAGCAHNAANYNGKLWAAGTRRLLVPLESFVFISSAYAQTAAAGDTQSTLMGMLPLVLMFVVMYFVMIRPQMKKAKDHKSMVEALAKGDEVVMASGMLGKLTKLGDTYLSVEIASGVEVQIQRSAVIQVLPKGTLK